jgi:outer membrane protein
MKKLLLAVSASCALFSGAAHAADIGPVMETKDWFVKIGGTYVMPNSAGTLPIPRQNPPVTVGNAFTGSLEAGRFLNDRFSLSLTIGIPPTHDVMVAGTKVGTVTLGAAALDAQFHLINDGPFDLYVGGGIAHNIYYSNTVPHITSVDSGFAPVLQAGAEYRVSDSIGVFVDVKKEFFTTTVHHGIFGPFQERLDPLAVTAGVAFHF